MVALITVLLDMACPFCVLLLDHLLVPVCLSHLQDLLEVQDLLDLLDLLDLRCCLALRCVYPLRTVTHLLMLWYYYGADLLSLSVPILFAPAVRRSHRRLPWAAAPPLLEDLVSL